MKFGFIAIIFVLISCTSSDSPTTIQTTGYCQWEMPNGIIGCNNFDEVSDDFCNDFGKHVDSCEEYQETGDFCKYNLPGSGEQCDPINENFTVENCRDWPGKLVAYCN